MTARENLSPYKPRLREYLTRRGVRITTTDADRIHCLVHEDEHPSMIIYERARGADKDGLSCPVCGAWLDIFEAARIIAGIPSGDDNFPKVLEEVRSVLGETGPAPALAAAPAPARQKKNMDYVSLSLDEARDFYTKSQILRLAAFGLCGRGKAADVFTNGTAPTEIEGLWKNLNPDGTLAFVEARFPASDFVDGKKKYLTIWFDGQHLKSANPPILLYNRDKLAKTGVEYSYPVLIHEGPKSIFGLVDGSGAVLQLGGEAIPNFIHTGWNSGGKKRGLCDFEMLRGRRVYIYPDDDEVGCKTALELKEILEEQYDCDVKVCAPLAAARALKPSGGADIVEALQVRTAEEMAEYIKSGPALKSVPAGLEQNEAPRGAAPSPLNTAPDVRSGQGTAGTTPRPPAAGNPSSQKLGPEGYPFRVLGTADDGLTYFLDRSGRLAKYKLSTLTKNQLQVLAPLSFWVSNYGRKGRADWDDATDAIIEVSGKIDFDPECIRGTGAWSERDGRLCYNDGRKVHGEYDDHGRVYLRRSYRDIGLGDAPAGLDLRREMVEAAMAMSFETPIDCARLLAWAILAPFGGALPWRPSGLITGDSESGKTTALNLVVRPAAGITDEDICTGGESSGAGVRQHDRYSSRPVVIEEADDDTDKKKRNREEIFSIMRESTSDDSPKAWKGTVDGQGMTFTMRKMFIFAAISPIVNANADKNRLFYVNMRKGEGGSEAWKPIKKRIQSAFTPTACRSLRAYTWKKLAQIIEGADFFSPLCEDCGRLSSRYAYLEAMLFSAYHIVFKDGLPDEAGARAFLTRAYELQKPETQTNEAEDMIERLLDEVVPITGDRARALPLRQILVAIKTRKQIIGGSVEDETTTELTTSELLKFKQTAWSYGLGVNRSGELCIVNNHHQITRITGHGRGYSKILKRHPQAVKDKVQGFTPFAGEPMKQCTYIAHVLETDVVPF